MAIGSLLLFLGILIIVALIVANPLMEDKTSESQTKDQTSHWLAERERILDALVELDVDWQMGKVPVDVYPLQRKQLVAKGARALKELEMAEKGKTRSKTAKDKDVDIEKKIDAYKARRKNRK